jgi:hypothetical protein
MEACTEETNDKIVVLKDKRARSTMRFLNPERKTLKKIQIDNCVVKVGIRCDFLLKCDKEIEHFVELKGRDVKHACDQISQTIKDKSNNAKRDKKWAFVVSSRNPLINGEIQILKARFRRDYNCVLIFKNSPCAYTITD